MPGTAMNRRAFLKRSSGLCFAFSLPLPAFPEPGGSASAGSISSWVRIDPDSRVTIASPAAELGQGSMTAIPMIFAEELDADWDQVDIEFSPADDAVFHNPTSWVRGIMLTLGSSAVSGYYDAVRLYGAQARKVLLQCAGDVWQVPVTELDTGPGFVLHEASGRRLSYGELATRVDPRASLPPVAESELKPEEDFRIIGSDLPRYDIPGKVNGSARYSIDVDLPGMLYAAVVHSPVRGGMPRDIGNRRAVEARPGIVEVVTLPDAVAIVARDYQAAWSAEKELDIAWSRVERLQDYSNDRGLESHLRMVRDDDLSGTTIQERGNVTAALAQAEMQYHAEYTSDYLYHAHMEPLNAVAQVHRGSVDVWVGTQAPTHCVRSVAAELGIDAEGVRLHRSYLGGAFGRRGAQDHDYVIDAVRLSRRMGAPVKVIWSREADVRTGRFKPLKAMRMEAGEDAGGRLIAWCHRTASDEALKQSDPYRYEKGGRWPVISSSGMAIDYDIEHVLAEMLDPDTGVRAAPLRGIGGTINKFAGESFLDEIAQEKNVDPLDLRLALLHGHEEPRRVLQTVARMSAWKKRKPGEGLGLAFHSNYYPTACVVKTAVDRQTGVITVPRIWMALYVGVAVHPRNILGQLESQIIFAISNVLKERITFRDGAVQQSNYHDYPVMRMQEIPQMEIEVLERRGAKPLGVGDSRLEPIPAAIANGFADLSGKRLRHLPFLPERVQAALAS